MKRYGDTKTSLALTAKAQSIYSNTDPCDIYETSPGVFALDICGDRRDGLTAEDVNEMLEELADEVAEEE